MRVLIFVSYDGTSYGGWQKQNNAPSIEEELDRAISDLFGQEIHVIGASRTDAGVHSAGSAAVFDVESRMPAEKVAYALNARLPEDIRVMSSREVPSDFHPRHTDTVKTYCYRIYTGRIMDPRYRLYMHQVYVPLDIEKMRAAAKVLEGEHDFKSFSSTATQVTDFVRTIYEIEVVEVDHGIEIRVTGNGFLYNMVRIIAGTLIDVGRGQIEVSAMEGILEARNREAAGPTAPAKGLALEEIRFLELDVDISKST